MMSRTIAANSTVGVNLTNASDSPVSITAGVTLSSATGPALYSSLSNDFSIANAGVLLASGGVPGSAPGLALAGGGTLSNANGGRISGYGFGVSIAGAGSIGNSGSIAAGATALASYNYYSATKSVKAVSAGLFVGSGGIYNAPGAAISGTFGGVALGASGTVVNKGAISASATTRSTGVLLAAGGAVTNAAGAAISGGAFGIFDTGNLSVTNLAGGTISGSNNGISLITGTGSVNNLGSITGTAADGVELFAGGTITNITSGTTAGFISGGLIGALIGGGAGYVLNQGTIRNNTLFTTQTYVFGGVILNAGGTVNNTGRILSGSHGVRIGGGTGTVMNSGYISSARTVGGGGAVNLQAGGSVSNSGAGTITGNFYGVLINGGTGSVTNAGTIFSPRTQAGGGVALLGGGSATNLSGGVIAGKWIGVQIGTFGSSGTAAAGTIVNQGSIFASDGGNGAAVWVHGPGIILNDTNAVIENDTNGTITGGPLNGVHAGAFGIVAYYQTTLTNLGTIGGTNGAFTATKRYTGTGVTNLVKMAPGAVFNGLVSGEADAADGSHATLELMSGASAGTIKNVGVKTFSTDRSVGYINFGNITIDSGARWALSGAFTAGATSTSASTITSVTTINGFGAGDSLTVVTAGSVSGASINSGGTLSLTEVLGNTTTQVAVDFTLTQPFSPAFFNQVQVQTASGAAVPVSVACFVSGTLIQTVTGPVPVESLRPGMRALTHNGDPAEIVWIGHREVDCRRHPDPAAVVPVRIRAGAFGAGLPSRDLLLSPDHAIFAAGVLIPVRCLINGDTIQRTTLSEVTYYHVELPAHGVILAENLPVESYLDAGGRTNFANGGGAVRLFPNFAARTWEMAGCAPLVTTGPVLERVKRTVASRPRVNNRYTYY